MFFIPFRCVYFFGVGGGGFKEIILIKFYPIFMLWKNSHFWFWVFPVLCSMVCVSYFLFHSLCSMLCPCCVSLKFHFACYLTLCSMLWVQWWVFHTVCFVCLFALLCIPRCVFRVFVCLVVYSKVCVSCVCLPCFVFQDVCFMCLFALLCIPRCVFRGLSAVIFQL